MIQSTVVQKELSHHFVGIDQAIQLRTLIRHLMIRVIITPNTEYVGLHLFFQKTDNSLRDFCQRTMNSRKKGVSAPFSLALVKIANRVREKIAGILSTSALRSTKRKAELVKYLFDLSKFVDSYVPYKFHTSNALIEQYLDSVKQQEDKGYTTIVIVLGIISVILYVGFKYFIHYH
jgi:hypothetical protein